MYMESPICNEELSFHLKNSTDIIKKSIHFLDTKSCFINTELDRIKEYLKFLLNKGKF
jgi:hypothetical protein